MIDVQAGASPDCLRIYLDGESSHFNNLTLLLCNLLGSRYNRVEDFWTVNLFDFAILKEKMDKLGLKDGRTLSTEAQNILKNFHSEQDRKEKVKKGTVELSPDYFKTKPYVDQLNGIQFLIDLPRAGIFDEMGVGKTLQILYSIQLLYDKGQVERVLVFCPNSVKFGWWKEIAKHTENFTSTIIPNGTALCMKCLQDYKTNPTNFLIVHYDCLPVPKKRKIKNKRGREYNTTYYPILEELLKLKFDQIVLDEGHLLKNEEAKRSQAVQKLLEEIKTYKPSVSSRPRVVVATGTPVAESPMDGYSMLRMIAPELLPTKVRFEKHFLIKERMQGHKRSWVEVTGYKNLRELKNLIESISIRRLKSDILGMPEKVFQTRDVLLSGEQAKLYEEIRKGVYDAIIKDPSKKLSIQFAMEKTIRLRQALNHPSLVDKKGDSAKYKELDLLLEEILANPKAKVVVWTEFVKAVDLLHSRYHQKYGAIKLYGGTSQKEVAELSSNFDYCPERIVIAIPKKAGTGIDFLSRARTAIYIEKPYSMIEYRQSVDRIHRRVSDTSENEIDIIKRSPASIVFLEAEKSVDKLVSKILGHKESISDAITIEDNKLVELSKSHLLEYLEN